MPDWLAQLKQLLSRGTEAARNLAEREAMALVLGQVAGKTVRGPAGKVLVEAGHRITEETAEEARRVGRLHALVSSVAAAGVQDLQERLEQIRRGTAEGREDAALNAVDDYVEARRCVGRVAVVDITDIRGNVVIEAGTRVREEHVLRARDHGLLRALVHSASLPQPAPRGEAEYRPSPEADAQPPDLATRPRLPLVDQPPGKTDQS